MRTRPLPLRRSQRWLPPWALLGLSACLQFQDPAGRSCVEGDASRGCLDGRVCREGICVSPMLVTPLPPPKPGDVLFHEDFESFTPATPWTQGQVFDQVALRSLGGGTVQVEAEAENQYLRLTPSSSSPLMVKTARVFSRRSFQDLDLSARVQVLERNIVTGFQNHVALLWHTQDAEQGYALVSTVVSWELRKLRPALAEGYSVLHTFQVPKNQEWTVLKVRQVGTSMTVTVDENEVTVSNEQSPFLEGLLVLEAAQDDAAFDDIRVLQP